MFSWVWLVFVRQQNLEHVRLKFFVLDVVTWFVTLQLVDNVISNLRLGWELEQVSHDVRNFLSIDIPFLVNVNNAESLVDKMLVEFGLLHLFHCILRWRQHICIFFD